MIRSKRIYVNVIFLIALILVSDFLVCGGGMPLDEQKIIDATRDEINQGVITSDNLIKTIDNVHFTHLSLLFVGLENSKLIDVWNKMEIKTSGVVDKAKTDKYRQMILDGIGTSLEKRNEEVDSFISELIKKNSKSSDFQFIGAGAAKDVKINGDFLDLTDAVGNVHKIHLKDLSGFKKMVFSEMKKGGEGYAVHYIFEKGSESAVILGSGYLKGDSSKGYEVMDLVGNEMKSVGHVNFGDNPSGAIYFRGVPKEVNGVRFSKGDYIFHKSGREGDISFKDVNGLLSSSSRDIGNEEGYRVGYQSENGLRGIKKLDTNWDGKEDRIIDVVHQNGVGVRYGDRIIGGGGNKQIEIKDRGEDMEVIFSREIINAEVINSNGKSFASYDSRQFSVGKGEAIKIVNGEINGLLVDRQGSGESDSGRILRPGSKGGFEFDSVPSKKEPSSDVLESLFSDASNRLTPESRKQQNQNLGKLSAEAQTHRFINEFRGTPLQLDPEMSRIAREYSKMMATQVGFRHSGMNYAENIAMLPGSGLSPEEVGRQFSEMWINSPGHRANILTPWKKEGIGIYYSPSDGYYYATQIFQ